MLLWVNVCEATERILLLSIATPWAAVGIRCPFPVFLHFLELFANELKLSCDLLFECKGLNIIFEDLVLNNVFDDFFDEVEELFCSLRLW